MRRKYFLYQAFFCQAQRRRCLATSFYRRQWNEINHGKSWNSMQCPFFHSCSQHDALFLQLVFILSLLNVHSFNYHPAPVRCPECQAWCVEAKTSQMQAVPCGFLTRVLWDGSQWSVRLRVKGRTKERGWEGKHPSCIRHCARHWLVWSSWLP